MSERIDDRCNTVIASEIGRVVLEARRIARDNAYSYDDIVDSDQGRILLRELERAGYEVRRK